MVGWILKKILGSKNQREIKRLAPLVQRINELDEQFKALSDDDLRAKTTAWKTELASISDLMEQWTKLDEILPEAFAVVKNACRRLMGTEIVVRGHPTKWDMVPFDVQLVGGWALHKGRIAEMATGEGKTLVATMPVYLNALTTRGVHVVTVNDYLAARDGEWMGAVYRFLGLSVGCILHDLRPERELAGNVELPRMDEQRNVGVLRQARMLLAGGDLHVDQPRVRVLRVVNGVFIALRDRELEVELDGGVRRAQKIEVADGIRSDTIDQLV